MSFLDKLHNSWQQNNSLLCVGLDPNPLLFPVQFHNIDNAIFEFNKAIIDATCDLVCAYKPQIAYFAAHAAEDQLAQTIAYIQQCHPQIPIILDAKRGDIGSTAAKYAEEAFVRYNVDAVTINPYMGFDSVEPFIAYKDKGSILLCRTSNSSAADIQDLAIATEKGVEPLFKRVARLASGKWNTHNNCLLVLGATEPQQMAEIREIAGDMVFLVPGIGAQGGDVEAMLKAGIRADGKGLIVSSSRSVLYASQGADFAEAARAAALNLRDQINRYRQLS